MKQKVIVQLVDTLDLGGTERMSVNLANTFQEQGWESHLVVSRQSGGLQNYLNPEVQVHFLEKKSFKDLKAFWRLSKLTRKIKPDYIHAHSTSIYWAVLLKMLVGSFKLIWHDHFGLSDQLEENKRSEMVILSKWIDRFIVVNHKLLDYWQKLLPYRKNSIVYLSNFPYLKLNESIQKLPQFTFLNLANYRPQKDQLTLIESCKILDNEGFDFRVLLVGQQVDSNWETQIKQKISEYSLQEKVRVNGPSEDVTSLLAEVHVGVLSSESEGLPVSLLEYGLAKLPVICTDVGNCAEVLKSGELGQLVKVKDPKLLAEAMKHSINNYEEEVGKAQQLNQYVLEEYGALKFFESYQKLVGAVK
ncbi:glycosyltransferase [Algoriphagus machipongonensis]|uniref:Glycosyl transferase n=1 Tax=Algoriphagus machipongonensis TaxID=388413 RepID=A3I1Z4_9BACT|nr:glycosyltransferase [Algoriphagus machipongonensis]EAZ79810.1 glycosyl transferase [Algoriphagus machipongonensis]